MAGFSQHYSQWTGSRREREKKKNIFQDQRERKFLFFPTSTSGVGKHQKRVIGDIFQKGCYFCMDITGMCQAGKILEVLRLLTEVKNGRC